jgi:hypothetical protein
MFVSIIEEVWVGAFGQCRECSKNRLEKIRIPRIITFPDSSDSENYTEVCQRGFKSHFDHPEMEGTSMVNSSRGIHNVSSNLRRCRKYFNSRKEYGKKKHVSTTW